jgi:Holliday junction resolvasome RuvABC ATP-dependent DNA helicase subunit
MATGEDEDQGKTPAAAEARGLPGQKAIKDNLQSLYRLPGNGKRVLITYSISGPPGLGKTTLAGILANEMEKSSR